MTDSHSRRGIPLARALLVVLGALLLLQLLGAVPWGFWGAIFPLWHVILIAIAVHYLFRKRVPRLATVVVLVLLGGAMAYATLDFAVVRSSGLHNDFYRAYGAEREGTEHLDVNLNFFTGNLGLWLLEHDPDRLYRVSILHDNIFTVTPMLERSGNHATLDFDVALDHLPLGKLDNWWIVKLSPDVDLDLNITGGAADMNLDFSAMRLSALTLTVAAADVDIALPSVEGTMRVEINAGAADITIDIPSDTAARIRSDGALTNLDIDGRFQHSGSYRVSDDWDTATNRIDIEIDTGVANVRVQ